MYIILIKWSWVRPIHNLDSIINYLIRWQSSPLRITDVWVCRKAECVSVKVNEGINNIYIHIIPSKIKNNNPKLEYSEIKSNDIRAQIDSWNKI